MRRFYHAHNDGILESWVVERTNLKNCGGEAHDCRPFRTRDEATQYLIDRAQQDIDWLKQHQKSLRKEARELAKINKQAKPR